MIKNNFKTEGGYTIIETMIAISLFIIIVTMGMGTLLNANLLHQKSKSALSIIDNLSFIMEDMSKNLRTGYDYHCYSSGQSIVQGDSMINPQDCPNGWAIAFESDTGKAPDKDGQHFDDQWVYQIATDPNGNTGIYKSVKSGIEGSWVPLSSDEIQIDQTKSSFVVTGARPPASNDFQQPFVTIKLVGKIIFQNIETPFSLETSVSQRNIDI